MQLMPAKFLDARSPRESRLVCGGQGADAASREHAPSLFFLETAAKHGACSTRKSV